MALLDMMITSRSEPKGTAPFDVTLSIRDEVSTKRYYSQSDLENDLLQHAQAIEGGITETFKQIADRGYIVCKVELSLDGERCFSTSGLVQ
jgi:hypothetical protein